MLTQDTLNTEEASTKNNVPISTGSFKKAWNRLSALSPRLQDTGEDQIERGEHQTQAKGTTSIGQGIDGEDAEAGPAPLDGVPAEATKRQQHSPFSSRAFDRLPQPVPVVDVFFGSWWLVSALRTATRPVAIYFSVFWLWTAIPFFDSFILIVVAIYLFRWGLLKAGRDTVPFIRGPIPGKRQLFWVLFRWIQKIWVSPCLAFLNYQDS